MKALGLVWAVLAPCWLATALAAEEDLTQLTLHQDEQAGYSLRLPPGYERLSEDESREVLDNLSEILGKTYGDKIALNPPAYFKGPLDPTRPNSLRPTLTISFSALGGPITADRIPEYKEKILSHYKKAGAPLGDPKDIKVEIVPVAGVNALRIEHELYSPVDNSRTYKVFLSIPGADRKYEVIFDCSPHQIEAVQQAVRVVEKTFKVHSQPMLNAAESEKWARVAKWTVGGFAAGIVLSLLLWVLTRPSAKHAEGATQNAPENAASRQS